MHSLLKVSPLYIPKHVFYFFFSIKSIIWVDEVSKWVADSKGKDAHPPFIGFFWHKTIHLGCFTYLIYGIDNN